MVVNHNPKFKYQASVPVAKYNEAMEWTFRNVQVCEYVTKIVDGRTMLIFSFARRYQATAFQQAFS